MKISIGLTTPRIYEIAPLELTKCFNLGEYCNQFSVPVAVGVGKLKDIETDGKCVFNRNEKINKSFSFYEVRVYRKDGCYYKDFEVLDDGERKEVIYDAIKKGVIDRQGFWRQVDYKLFNWFYINKEGKVEELCI